MKKEVVSVYVDNKANVLTRVVSLYGRRGFNIDSLTVSATNDPAISRITIVFEGDNLTLHQIVSQTEKLEIVRSIKALRDSESFFRELLMVKVHADKNVQGDQGNRRHLPRQDHQSDAERDGAGVDRKSREARCFLGYAQYV